MSVFEKKMPEFNISSTYKVNNTMLIDKFPFQNTIKTLKMYLQSLKDFAHSVFPLPIQAAKKTVINSSGANLPHDLLTLLQNDN